jgi:hypothetical protein
MRRAPPPSVAGSIRWVLKTDSPSRTGARTRSKISYWVGLLNSAITSRSAFDPTSIPAQRMGKEVFVGEGINAHLPPAEGGPSSNGCHSPGRLTRSLGGEIMPVLRSR